MHTTLLRTIGFIPTSETLCMFAENRLVSMLDSRIDLSNQDGGHRVSENSGEGALDLDHVTLSDAGGGRVAIGLEIEAPVLCRAARWQVQHGLIPNIGKAMLS